VTQEVDAQVAANMLDVTPAALRQLRRRGKISPTAKRSKHGRHTYRLADVISLIEQRTTVV
jgi:DNA-binding transcriptional MerR regulator